MRLATVVLLASLATSDEGNDGDLGSLLAMAVSLLAHGFQLHVLGLELLDV